MAVDVNSGRAIRFPLVYEQRRLQTGLILLLDVSPPLAQPQGLVLEKNSGQAIVHLAYVM